MPKVVDHDQRREELARAVWAVIARAGVEGATVRAVAAEAGWSMGALRYYFATQDGLLRFALEVMLRRTPERLRIQLASGQPGLERAQRIIEELLPLDPDRLAEGLVWLAFLTRARVDRSFDDLRETGWRGERYVCRLAVAEIAGCPWPVELNDTLPGEELEAAAADLHTFVDGLTLQGATFPEELPPERLRGLLRRRLEVLEPAVREDGRWTPG
ncbi:TetR family transcriptional regulator C-terminal domain-containing protein [Micromonospora sp. NBC_01699]|uniref:TetR/AcrR family transcriptional regulator n=1 Tax=Micromonospora sp. NBC_01699 TaxID=2975984 RepID=UPI002E2D7E39|nr:TetR family transcriptional regulator C-terminal domain-containing protein [Micromonospora sp. NBC_01699]